MGLWKLVSGTFCPIIPLCCHCFLGPGCWLSSCFDSWFLECCACRTKLPNVRGCGGRHLLAGECTSYPSASVAYWWSSRIIGSRDASVSHSFFSSVSLGFWSFSAFIVERIMRWKSMSGRWAPRYGSSHKQNPLLQMYKTPVKSGLNGLLLIIQSSILIISTNSCVYVPDHLGQDQMPMNCWTYAISFVFLANVFFDLILSMFFYRLLSSAMRADAKSSSNFFHNVDRLKSRHCSVRVLGNRDGLTDGWWFLATVFIYHYIHIVIYTYPSSHNSFSSAFSDGNSSSRLHKYERWASVVPHFFWTLALNKFHTYLWNDLQKYCRNPRYGKSKDTGNLLTRVPVRCLALMSRVSH